MSRVLVKGEVRLVQGPWQYDCRHCRSVVELTVDMLKSHPGDRYWNCPGCGAELNKYDVTKGAR